MELLWSTIRSVDIKEYKMDNYIRALAFYVAFMKRYGYYLGLRHMVNYNFPIFYDFVLCKPNMASWKYLTEESKIFYYEPYTVFGDGLYKRLHNIDGDIIIHKMENYLKEINNG